MPSGAGWKQSSFAGLITKPSFLPHQHNRGLCLSHLPRRVLTFSFPHEAKAQRHLLKGALLLLTRQLLLPQGSSQEGGTRPAKRRVAGFLQHAASCFISPCLQQAVSAAGLPQGRPAGRACCREKVLPGRGRHVGTTAAVKASRLLQSLAVFFT